MLLDDAVSSGKLFATNERSFDLLLAPNSKVMNVIVTVVAAEMRNFSAWLQ